MAKMIRRYWWVALLQVALLVMAVGWLSYRTLHRVETVKARDPDPPPQALDALTYSRVQALREQLALTNADLAAMGCNRQTAEQAMSGLLSWYQQNQATWQQKETAVHTAQSAYAEMLRQVRIGPANPELQTQLDNQKETLDAANTAWTTFIGGAASAVAAGFSAEQAAVWTKARGNLATTSRYRYVSGIAGADAARLNRVLRKRGEGSPALSTLEQSLLSGNIRAEMATALTNRQSHMTDVTAAEAATLPRPSIQMPK